MKVAVFIFAIAVVANIEASAIHKCTDSAGKVTFSQHGCGQETQQESLKIKEAARPSGDGPSVRMAKPVSASPRPQKRRTFNHCGDLTQVDIAHAKSNGDIIVGMTGQDVREIWGAPTEINYSADGEQWIYPITEYKNRYLYVDTRGCFIYWN